jgi:hypothetical protein
MIEITIAGVDDLRQLQAAWHTAVVLGDQPGSVAPCWFGQRHQELDLELCSGSSQGAHWIKRQQVERWMAQQLDLPEIVRTANFQRRRRFPLELIERGLELVYLAAWDPRNGVAACEFHHKRFDSQLVGARRHNPILRHQIPMLVEEFAADLGLWTPLEERHPGLPPDWANV